MNFPRFAVAAAIAAVPVAAMAMPASEYVMKAGAGDQYEIQSSKLVMKSTADPHVKQFADMMVRDHMKSTNIVKAAAMKDGMRPGAPMLDADGQQMMSDLMAAKGPDRDKLYWRQQAMAHDKALALHKDESMNGMGALKGAANQIVPVVQQHEQMLQEQGAHSM